ncbi:hypothetical protein L596_006930 [Steinernema carpocapsae]|uniref:Uncharacterized protein n=1 Tax=Steinernema carpocapsae TaxID=34508 RepID=A0A4U5P7J7_STECR|nr:hypothetical protein L596_006930 [Steinernema carpocapsae]
MLPRSSDCLRGRTNTLFWFLTFLSRRTCGRFESWKCTLVAKIERSTCERRGELAICRMMAEANCAIFRFLGVAL